MAFRAVVVHHELNDTVGVNVGVLVKGISVTGIRDKPEFLGHRQPVEDVSTRVRINLTIESALNDQCGNCAGRDG